MRALDISSLLKDLHIKVIPETCLANYTTFALGGKCPFLIECASPAQLIASVQRLAENNQDFLIIGSGSNLLVSDSGIQKIVIRYVSPTPLIQLEGDNIIVSGSTLLDSLAMFTAQEGLGGLVFASGIPGTVGGAVVGNAGAFGQQMSDILLSATIMDKSGKVWEAKPEELRFQYRNSRLKETGEIVVSARFRVRKHDSRELLEERERILKMRQEKHPNLNQFPCAGSFFKNIPLPDGKRVAAGRFLEEAGVKDLRVGGAFVFPKHANIVVKGDDCLAQDVLDLACKMAELVKKKFNITLEREVRLLGAFRQVPLSSKRDFY